MADYDSGTYSIPSSTIEINNNISTTSFQYPIGFIGGNGGVNNHFVIPHQTQYNNPNNNNQNINHYHGVDIDTATIVSIASSCIILISGCIAVVCLIMYMKKTDMLYRSRTCAKCGAHVTATSHENENIASGTPISIRSENRSERAEHVAKIINYQMAAKSQQNLNKEIDSIVIYRGLPNTNNVNNNTNKQNENQLPLFNTDQPNSSTCLDFFETKTSFIEDDEAAPYATFNLPGFESDSKISDTYETFAAKFSEPPYMLLKKGIECPPQYADTIDCKLRMMDNNKATINDPIYQSNIMSQYHSIASCSSNQDELIRAYEFGKEQKQKLLKVQNEVIKQLAGDHENDTNHEAIYRSMPISDHESPTDPGIREFTKSPPKPNEKRQGIVFHHQPTVADILKISKHIIDQKEFSAKTSINNHEEDDFKHELSSNETTNSLSSLKASSVSPNTDDSTPSGGSELGNDEASSSTATPENLSESIIPKNFGAISRDRSRNPSWATYTTMKSNTVLTLQNEVQSERAFVTFPEKVDDIKEGLSSDEEEFNKNRKTNPSEFEQSMLVDVLKASSDVYESSSSSLAHTKTYFNTNINKNNNNIMKDNKDMIYNKISFNNNLLESSSPLENKVNYYSSGNANNNNSGNGASLESKNNQFKSTGNSSNKKTITSEIDC